MRVVSVGHVVFSTAMICLGFVGFVTGDFAGVWGGVPGDAAGRETLAYVCAFVALAGGVGLLWRRTAAAAALILLLYLSFWLLAFKLPFILRAPLQEVSYQTCGETAVIAAGASALFVQFAGDID